MILAARDRIPRSFQALAHVTQVGTGLEMASIVMDGCILRLPEAELQFWSCLETQFKYDYLGETAPALRVRISEIHREEKCLTIQKNNRNRLCPAA